MKNIYIFEMGDIYDNQVRLPYSTGLIWSYCKTFDQIKNNYNLKKWFFYKKSTNDILKDIINPSVAIFSSFIWNWELNCEVAKSLKSQFPNILIIFGGAQVPHNDQFFKDSESESIYWGYPLKEWFKHHPYIDIISSGEGEYTIKDILLENLSNNPKFENIPGCVINRNNKFLIAPFRERIKNVNDMPSPYLDGSFNNLIEERFKYIATIETTRGCPFHCAFCDQGHEYFNKISLQNLKKIKKEISWCIKNKVFYIDNADSNFGMFYERDKAISEFLVKCKKKYGYPQQYNTAWAKGKTLNSVKIMKILKESDLDRGANMAFQSFDDNVLKNIGRKNMSDGSILKTIESFEKENIGVYVELILGLSGETKESFLSGIFNLLEMGHHKFMGIYPLQILPNTKYCDKDYIKKYNFIFKRTKTNAAYIDPKENNQKDLMIVGSKTMPHEDWFECFLYKVLIVGCHCYGSTQYLSRYLNSEYNITYRNFYTKLYEWSIKNTNTVIGKEILETKKTLIDTLENNAHWNRLLPEISSHTWVHEEAMAIMIIKNKKNFYDELLEFIRSEFFVEISDDIFNKQYYGVVDPNVNYPKEINNMKFELNWNRENFEGNYSEWAKECIWWGRKSSRYLTKITEIK
jgi:radical SAM superfamily enzyme YgiQ (UPF0313 family)